MKVTDTLTRQSGGHTSRGGTDSSPEQTCTTRVKETKGEGYKIAGKMTFQNGVSRDWNANDRCQQLAEEPAMYPLNSGGRRVRIK